jgi:site-specific recombinase XerD
MKSAHVKKPKLLERLREAIRVRHYSIRTEEVYVMWVRRYILFHNKQHPEAIDATHVSAFLSHLAMERHVAASTQNQALCAIVFLYRHVLDTDIGELGPVVRAKRPRRLPKVLTRTEVKAVLSAMNGDYRLMAEIMTSEPFRNCWAIKISARHKSIPM